MAACSACGSVAKGRARFTDGIKTNAAGAIDRSTISGVFLDEHWPVLRSLVGAVVAELNDKVAEELEG